MNKKGQVLIPVTIAIAAFGMSTTTLVKYFSDKEDIKESISSANVDIKVLQNEKENIEDGIVSIRREVEEHDKSLIRIERKVDTLLIQQGINPASVIKDL